MRNFLARLKRKASSRTNVMIGSAEPGVSSRPQPQRPTSDFEGLNSGRIGSNEVFIDMSSTDLPEVPNDEPWFSFPDFLAFINRRLMKLPRPFRPRKAHRTAPTSERQHESLLVAPNSTTPMQTNPISPIEIIHEDGMNNSSNTLDTSSLLDTLEEEEEEEKGRVCASVLSEGEPAFVGMNVRSDGKANFDSQPKDGTDMYETTTSPKTNFDTLLNSCSNAEIKDPTKASGPQIHLYSHSSHTNTTLESDVEYPVEFILEHPDKGSVDHVTTAVMMQTPAGVWKPVKLLFDTGTADNFASKAIVLKFGYPQRPILPKDIQIYRTIGGDFTPGSYVEIELQDEEHGIEKKVKFIVAPNTDFELLAGRILMTEHGMLPLANGANSQGAHVITVKKPSKGMFVSYF